MKKIIKKLTLLAIVLVLLQGAHISNAKVNALGASIKADLNGGTVDQTELYALGWRIEGGEYKRLLPTPPATSKQLMAGLDKIITPPSGMVFDKWDPEPDDIPLTAEKLFTAQWKPAPVEPEPVEEVKDERCEVVIGPTWHWNNDLGVCEEYTVVATSTR